MQGIYVIHRTMPPPFSHISNTKSVVWKTEHYTVIIKLATPQCM